jgi:hypothetical protein
MADDECIAAKWRHGNAQFAILYSAAAKSNRWREPPASTAR